MVRTAEDKEKLRKFGEWIKRNNIKNAKIILLPEDWIGMVHTGDTTFSAIGMRLFTDGSYSYD